MKKQAEIFIVADRYGYWKVVAADSIEEAVRLSSNLASGSKLDHANTSFICLYDQTSEEEIQQHNCGVAMDFDMECQCGLHE